MNREHRLKSLPPYFRAVVEGRKPFEIREDDRAFDEGDVLVLCEWEPLKGFTGAEVEAPVTYVMRGGDLGLERGYAILGIHLPETYSPAPARESAPPLADDARVAGDVLCKDPNETHEDPGADGQQVAGDDGDRPRGVGPAVPESAQAAPPESQPSSTATGTGSAEGGPPTPAAAANWGRVAGDVMAWHLWQEGAGEAECGEATDAEIVWLSVNTGMDPERVCLDCKDLFAEMQAEEHQVGELNDNNATIVRSALSTPATKRKHRCAGFNKSAGLVCNTLHVHFEVDGKWFCKRHNPLKPKKVRPTQEAAA